MPFSVLFLVSLTLSYLPVSLSYRDGARSESCYNMLVMHTNFLGQAVSPMECGNTCPFELRMVGRVNVENRSTPMETTYQFGETYHLQLISTSTAAFEGFMVEARNFTEDFEIGSTIWGTWVTDLNLLGSRYDPDMNLLYHTVECNRSLTSSEGPFDNAATQDSPDDLTSLDLYWRAPSRPNSSEEYLQLPEQIQFWFVTVQQRLTYFSPIAGPTLNRPVDCGPLTNPDNGRVDTPQGTTFNQVATYSCNNGYLLVGNMTRTCQVDGRWSGTDPFCFPGVLSSCNITLSYNQSSGRLLIINSTWDTVPVPDPVDPGEACPGPTGNITQYQISLQTGSVVVTENVNIARCTVGRCSYTFEPPSNPPSSYDSVSVAAENVVGVGPATTCTTQPISTNNNLLTGEVIDLSLPSDARINCTFLSGFTGSAHCTVQYGTDPTYMNLPYSAESTETGTAGDTVSVVLRERLNSSTVYYYTVSAVSGDVTVTARGVFTTPQYNCPLSELQTAGPHTNDKYPQCQQDLDTVISINIPNGVVNVTCYSGRQFVSVASHVCDEGYQPNATSSVRVCRDNGLWSGTIIVCEDVQTTFSTCPAVEVAAAVTGTITLVVGVLAGVLAGGLLFYCISKHQSQSSKPKSSFHQQQQAAVPQQRAGPEYEEVVELKENTAYGPTRSIELKACEAYVPVQH